MRKKLSTTLLLALSVSALETELAFEDYTATELADAAKAEAAGDNRKTALEAIAEAAEGAAEVLETAEAGLYVAEGKAITTNAGMLKAGEKITAGHLAGGEKALAQLVKGGHCVLKG